MENLYSDLTKNYSLSKTLRFELIPQGKTSEYIEKNGMIPKDVERNVKYKRVKKYCDQYHKIFIEKCLYNFQFEGLNEYYNLYKIEKKTDEERKNFKKVQEALRKQISNAFKTNGKYKGLFGKDMINKYLEEIYKNDSEKMSDISEFAKFTTYFSGYNKNRENMYSEEEKSTAISYRIINENLPVFINNMKLYNNVKDKLPIELIYKELEEYIQVESLDNIFELEYFNDALTETGIELYNLIISGKSEEDNKKIKGLNEYINEYNQKNNTKYPKLNTLYKQILSDKVGISFVIDSIECDNELIELIQSYYTAFEENRVDIENVISNIDKFDCSKIYVNNNLDLTKISQEIFSGEENAWNVINIAIKKEYADNYIGKDKVDSDKYNEKQKKYLKSIDAYSIEYLDEILLKHFGKENYVKNYFSNYLKNNNCIDNIRENYNNCKKIFEENNNYQRELINEEIAIEKIKTLLDSLKKYQEFIKLLVPKNNTLIKDDNFYNVLIEKYQNIKAIIEVYNKSRNYLTQKPYSNEKIKLNFDNSTLLSGWDLNKEKDNLGTIFIKEGKYYLGIINPFDRKIFDDIEYSDDSQNSYQKMVYKFMPSVNKSIPKCSTQLNEVKAHFENSNSDYILENDNFLKPLTITKKIFDLNNDVGDENNKKDKKFSIGYLRNTNDEEGYKDALYTWIDFCKDFLKSYKSTSVYDLSSLKKTEEYERLDVFYNELDSKLYSIKFENIPDSYINSLVDSGKLYLFLIYNKDFSEHSKGKPNLHTMYWKALFDKDNLENVAIKLNGQAEIFYRKASLHPDKPTHKANEPIKNKNQDNKKETSTFDYDLIKDKRYTKDKFLFHVPITLNYINKGLKDLNEVVKLKIKENADVNVIGIDRGERNLLYITVINSKGEILEQESLNEILNEYKGNTYKVNYHDLLDKKEKDREAARESWKTVENIKELKEGYLSQVIHKIAELMDKYNAIIVLEDLNSGFKNSRIKVEKQVYQKFEKMLIEKLNYLVFKDKEKLAEGGYLNGYQLTNAFESFEKMGKQSGILFYIPAWCTSKIDSTTGFINLLSIKYENIEKSKEFIKKFDDIKYNQEEDYFEFYMDYSKFTNRPYGIRKNWTVCTNSTRIKTFRNKNNNNNWDCENVELTKEFERLFDEYHIDIHTNIKENILYINEKDFYVRLLELIRLTFQMRNSKSGDMEDYIISPVKNAKGNFFDSRNGIETLPKDADANGAYNIARKGLMLVEQIKETEPENLGKIKYKIKNQEWLEYVQRKDI